MSTSDPRPTPSDVPQLVFRKLIELLKAKGTSAAVVARLERVLLAGTPVSEEALRRALFSEDEVA